MANFVCSNQVDIIIITNKIAVLLNLQIIEKYVKKHKLHWDRQSQSSSFTSVKILPKNYRYLITYLNILTLQS